MIKRREVPGGTHALRALTALTVVLSSTPVHAVSLYTGVKTRTAPAPLTGCCTVPAKLPTNLDGALKPGAPELQIPQLPQTQLPEGVKPVAPVAPDQAAQAPKAIDQAQGLNEQIKQAAQPGDDSTRVSLNSTFDGSGENAADAAAFDESFVAAAQRAFHPTLPTGQAPAVAVGVAVRPQGAPVDDAEIQARMGLSPLTNPEREQTVKDLFIKAGAQASEIVTQPAGRGRNNYYVVKKGKTDRVIVVGAHHDKVSEGRGTIDNWTGTTMMINLYQAMRDVDTDATYVFIAFAREEEGLIGSEVYVNSLSQAQRSKVDAMLNLDTLGVDGTFSWQNNSTRAMLDRIKQVAAADKRDLLESRLDGGDADSSTFRRARIAAMTLFGASQDVIFDIIHSSRDNMAAFNLPHYRNSYLLSLALLKDLDKAPIGPQKRV